MKKFYGRRVFVQSAGVKSDLEVDGFSVAVSDEIGVALARHHARSFTEMEQWGDRIDAYDLIVALSPAAQRRAGIHPLPRDRRRILADLRSRGPRRDPRRG